MSPEEAFIKYQDVPLRDSVVPVVRSLAGKSLMVGVVGPWPESSRDSDITVSFRMAQDKDGKIWVCAYTSETAFLDAFPNGSEAASTTVEGLIDLVERNDHLEGITFDNTSDGVSYFLFRSMFEDAKRALRRDSANRSYPWVVLHELRSQATDASFPARWRSFILACSDILPPELPEIAKEWTAIARFFEDRSPGERSALFEDARKVYFRHQDQCTSAEAKCGLLVALSTLAPTYYPDEWDSEHWYTDAVEFLDNCAGAGLKDDDLNRLIASHLMSD